eukprot:CAMPEP_0115760974 /NCGR_PEP_ID=MMETSP0272-20121206/100271_1 /TAXON_ID=71861 /ORGANISM="Scrippsiella trochoidea, Strain CCMP3099" /LENGTH=86 /DNA_ID=CAMNT_0003206647 /DNA_START=143 /DNA_END=403 /DNA_ORIENTATION=-
MRTSTASPAVLPSRCKPDVVPNRWGPAPVADNADDARKPLVQCLGVILNEITIGVSNRRNRDWDRFAALQDVLDAVVPGTPCPTKP